MKKDKREPQWAKQRKLRGFDDRDTWSLDHTLAKWLAPRLKRFKEIDGGRPITMPAKQWSKILQTLIDTFEFIASDKYWIDMSTKRNAKTQKGLQLFAKYYSHLWW